ncbi:hypothetical protein FJT64_019950 [Amphibalanus amphitrite]|uniref:Uncharacterized protein n=1 Tax=Amphibalanus amphitrite TaxID=1232801 RepID=A0A6A4X3K2_AMPAM|nr:hypothetical protein FJT64_019950 [Amphibalanus amphitrite]
MTEALSDFEAYLTTYRRDYAVRTLEMTGPLPQSIPAPVKTQGAGLESNKRPRRRSRRPAEASSLSQNGGGFILPGRSLTVGPAPGVPRPPSHGDERDHQVSEALKIDLPDGDNTDYNQWLLSKLPEIVEKCCRQQEPPPRVIEVLPPPVRRKIRINVTANPNRTSPGRRQDDHPEDPAEGSTDEFVLDGAELRQVHRPRSPSRRRQRQRRRSARRGTSSSASSLESVRRTAGDAATAELVRRVLEEMFGPRPATGGGGSEKQKENHSRNRNRSSSSAPVSGGSPPSRPARDAVGSGRAVRRPVTQLPLPSGGDSVPSSGRSWASPQLLELHSEDRPYRPLASPPPRHADTPRSESGAEDGPRTSSPVAAAPPAVCSHRQAAEDIDSTDVLLSYDPWHAIENDFKTLLN